MPLVDKTSLVLAISPPLDRFLATQLIDEFIALERRYVLRDWEPAELDGGQFAEILARVIYHQDSGNLSLGKSFEDCYRYVENDAVAHRINPRHNCIHLFSVLKMVYKFRSQRGAVHISPTYTANQLDAKLMVESVRWAFGETLRIFWEGDRETVASAVREILQFDVPCIGRFDDVILVQRTDLTADEEVLVLLHYAGELGMSRKDIGKFAQISPPAVTTSLKKLVGSSYRQVILLKTGLYRLTDLGHKRIRETLADKLVLQ